MKSESPDTFVRDHDEAMTTMLRVLPDALYNFFAKCKDKGFSEAQALTLTTEFLRSLYGVKYR
jgi:hypothetical protein